METTPTVIHEQIIQNLKPKFLNRYTSFCAHLNHFIDIQLIDSYEFQMSPYEDVFILKVFFGEHYYIYNASLKETVLIDPFSKEKVRNVIYMNTSREFFQELFLSNKKGLLYGLSNENKAIALFHKFQKHTKALNTDGKKDQIRHVHHADSHSDVVEKKDLFCRVRYFDESIDAFVTFELGVQIKSSKFHQQRHIKKRGNVPSFVFSEEEDELVSFARIKKIILASVERHKLQVAFTYAKKYIFLTKKQKEEFLQKIRFVELKLHV